jgi:general secretion pathway protein D
MMRKIENIVIPLLSFNQLPLDRVISTLSELAKENDASTTGVKGVNLVMINPSSGATAPQSVTLSDLSLKRMLDVITDMYSYTYTVENDIIRIKPSGGDVNLSTEQVSLSKAAFTRMTGLGAIVPSSGASSDPFAPAPAASSASVGSGGDSEAIRRFLQAAGVTFENVPGSSIAYDGSQVFVTQTDRNIEKILNIFKRYDDVRQVEIEAKFMDVAEGKLNEFGIKWGASGSNFNGTIGFGTNVDGAIQPTNTNMTNPLGSAVRGLTEASAVNTTLPGGMNLGAASGNIGTLAGASIGEFTVDAQLRALAQSSGSDLLSAPKATVLSDQTAVLEVVQLLKYPKTYSEATIEPSQVSNGVIIPGQFKPSLPQEIGEEKVGVVLKVTPKVEDDGKIDLTLEPRVTEFEGFVDYGSAASVGGQTVVLPYLQPIFAYRSITTRVVVWDGATIVMGGLTREETRKVDDKIPVLGDMPFIGRLFKSKGESTQKRNLLIFVTANLVSPGGSLSRQSLKGVERGATFQNPTVVTPGGSESRIRSN